MPSRKRNKGKARKSMAKASATPKANAGRGGKTQLQQQEREQNNQLLGQLINNQSLEEDGCYHGCPPPPSDSCSSFVHDFESELIATERDTGKFQRQEIPDMPPWSVLVYMVLDFLKKEELIEDCKCASSRKWILLHLASLGTDYLLKGQSLYTEMAATVAFVFLSVEALEDKSTDDDFAVKTRDLVQGGDRDIVRFFSQRGSDVHA